MKFYISIFILTILLTACSCNTCKYLSTTEISKGLYLESYQTLNLGVWGEMSECYITDSVSFRTKIGSFDEHGFFTAKLNGETIEAYNLDYNTINDTTETKIINKVELFSYHHSVKQCLKTKPIFGKNTILCDTDFFPTSSYQTEQGIYQIETQFKCGNDYKNAIYFSDSLNFSVFAGVYEPGSRKNNYTIHKLDSIRYVFYNIEDVIKNDTVGHTKFLLADLKKKGLMRVCKL